MFFHCVTFNGVPLERMNKQVGDTSESHASKIANKETLSCVAR
jgi:hypothetical protein